MGTMLHLAGLTDGAPEIRVDYTRRMREIGVRVVGACCGSSPEHVAQMRRAPDGQGAR